VLQAGSKAFARETLDDMIFKTIFSGYTAELSPLHGFYFASNYIAVIKFGVGNYSQSGLIHTFMHPCSTFCTCEGSLIFSEVKKLSHLPS
jgi:hypothetical protein